MNFGHTEKFSIFITFLKAIFQICASAVEIEKMNRHPYFCLKIKILHIDYLVQLNSPTSMSLFFFFFSVICGRCFCGPTDSLSVMHKLLWWILLQCFSIDSAPTILKVKPLIPEWGQKVFFWTLLLLLVLSFSQTCWTWAVPTLPMNALRPSTLSR